MAANLIEKITKQIEYYFGDINLSKDKFLRDLTGKEDGWIPISTLLTFKRLKAITEKESDIVNAFENGKSEIVELNEAKDKLRRSTPLPDVEDEEYKKSYRLRTIHLKGFPKENTTLDELIEFSSQYGRVESVQMRKFEDKTFKGCCMTTFENIESANRALSGNELFKGETELKLRENKETYLKRKKLGRKGEFKKENKLINLSLSKDKDENDEKKDDNEKKDDKLDQNENKEVTEQKEVEKINDQEMSEQNEEENEKNQEKTISYEKGCIIKFVDLPDDIKYWQIKNTLKNHASVKYVDIFPEKNTGLARFSSKEEADKALQALDYTENIAEKSNEKVETSENDKTEENSIEKSNEEKKEAEQDDKTETSENGKTEETKSIEENGFEKSNDEKEENQENKSGEVMASDKNVDTANQTDQKVKEKNGSDQKTITVKKMKIDDNIILNYIVLEGEEEKEHWLKLKNLNLGNRESYHKNNHKKHNNNNNKRRFGKYKNNNKRSSNNDRNNTKRAKFENA